MSLQIKDFACAAHLLELKKPEKFEAKHLYGEVQKRPNAHVMHVLSLHQAYLTDRQFSIWNMLRSGFSQSEIARRLGISRQAVSQLARSIPGKVTTALTDAARLNHVEPRLIDSSRGVLVGWSNEFRTETVITLNPKVGLRIWYRHNLGQCKICPDEKRCKSLLLENAREFGVSLARNEREMEPSKLSSIIFSRLMGTSK